ncbi:GNAT family N-acetyltransferase [Planococcus sp. CAU13]|uniref:GNAT family N-acetyltransferase n=1 Tax=Planococcus sp. CAU13 TaxID=1541197 RepID=UPI0005300A0F|nr:GNAT family N-acetyltransferase [Planococcus sp. CAU13]
MFETERCYLSAFQKSDRDDVAQLFSDPAVRTYLGGVRKRDAIKVILDEMLASMDDAYYWVVREKGTAEFMGLISLDLHHEGVDQELSYQFLPGWWGRGYAYETAAVIIDFALEELKLPGLVAETQSANLASCRLLEKLGMTLERTVVRFGAEQSIYAIRPV